MRKRQGLLPASGALAIGVVQFGNHDDDLWRGGAAAGGMAGISGFAGVVSVVERGHVAISEGGGLVGVGVLPEFLVKGSLHIGVEPVAV